MGVVSKTTRDVYRACREHVARVEADTGAAPGTVGEISVADLRGGVIYETGPSRFPLPDKCLRDELKLLETFGMLARVRRSPARWKLNASVPELPEGYLIDLRDGWIFAPLWSARGSAVQIHFGPELTCSATWDSRHGTLPEPPTGITAVAKRSEYVGWGSVVRISGPLESLERMARYVADLSFRKARL